METINTEFVRANHRFHAICKYSDARREKKSIEGELLISTITFAYFPQISQTKRE